MSVKIYYDGDCFFCRNYVFLMRLKEKYGSVELISLRESPADLKIILDKKINPNTGFIVQHGDDWYHGAKAFSFLNSAVTSSGLLAQLLRAASSNQLLASFIYNMLVLGRFLTLAVQGLGLINQEKNMCNNNYLHRSIRLSLLSVISLVLVQTLVIQQWNYFSLVMLVGAIWLYLLSLKSTLFFETIDSYFNGKSIIFWFYFCIWCALVTNIFELISVRRIAFFFSVFPLFGDLLDLYKTRLVKVTKKSFYSLILLLLFVSFPGVYLAPFYGGIAGWFEKTNKNEAIYATTYELINNENQAVVLNHALLEPSSMLGRFDRAFKKKKSEVEFKKFLFENYTRLYPLLQKGTLSHQRKIGVFSYPTHTLADSNANDYNYSFRPANIKSLVQCRYKLNWEKKVLSRSIINELRLID